MEEAELMEEAASTIREHDKDSDGTLNFKEFMSMLTKDPWVAMLPENVRGRVGSIISQLP